MEKIEVIKIATQFQYVHLRYMKNRVNSYFIHVSLRKLLGFLITKNDYTVVEK